MKSQRLTAPDLKSRKNATPLVAVAAYGARQAAIIDDYVDIILVGDSLAMTLYGHETTLAITLDTMIMHARAVVGATSKSFVIIDMPFGTTEQSPEQAFANCARAIAESGAQAVKIEGGQEISETVEFLTQRGILVVAHIGLLPQRINAMGGFRVQGRDEGEDIIAQDGIRLAEAGAIAMVVEGVPEKLADRITREVPIPTIGIGASKLCDGQILVLDDLLGLTENPAKFVRQFSQHQRSLKSAIKKYKQAVQSRDFPQSHEVY